MKIVDRIYLSKLFEIYGLLLTDKQTKIFMLYYYEDYSINEISSKLNITKNGVYNALETIKDKLLKYEKKINVFENYNYNVQLLEKKQIDLKIIKKLK